MKELVAKLKSLIFKNLVRPIIRVLEALHYPGEEHTSIYQILRFFLKGIMEGSIQTRARSISFSFFLALLPSIIFIFTLIPYIPIENLDVRILQLLQELMPVNTFEATRTTIEDILQQPRGGLLSIGFIIALYVSTNGVFSLIEGFNQSYHGIQQRSGISQRLISIFLTGLLAVIMILSIALIIFTEYTSAYLLEQQWLTKGTEYYLLHAGKWIILIIMVIFTFSAVLIPIIIL